MAHRTHKSRRHAVRDACRCEPLETRRLLSFTLTGTAGDDLIQVSYDDSDNQYEFTLNGSPAGATQDPSVVIDSLAGHDTVMLHHVAENTEVLVQTGIGNDRIEFGNGNLAANLRGDVTVSEPGGLDELIANDSLDNFVPDRPVTLGTLGPNFAVFSSPSVGDAGSVRFNPAVENVYLLCSDGADTVHVDAVREGTLVSLGGGNDRVVYDGGNHVVPDLLPATIAGGEGFDDIIIDDSNGPPETGRVYDFDETHILNQTVSGFENLTVETRSLSFGPQNYVHFHGGFPVGDNISVDSTNLDVVNIGTPSSPIDLDDYDLIFTNDAGVTRLYDQDGNGSAFPFEIWNDGTPNKQRVDKGGFRGVFREYSAASPDLVVQAGSTNDVFEVSEMDPQFELTVRGGPGNDTVNPANRNGHQRDIDAIFPFQPGFRGQFEFDGEEGTDVLNLDDNDDQLGDGDQNYYIGISGQNGFVNLTKGTSPGPAFASGLVDWRNIEDIYLIGDPDSNTFYFDDLNARLYVHGGSGNDIFTNFNPLTNNGSLVDAAAGGALVGGDGDDSATLDDSRNHFVQEYAFDTAGFTYRSGAGTFGFLTDSLLENISLDQSNAPVTTTLLRSKRPATRLTLSGRGGIDTFIVGGGDIDASGLSASTTTLLGGTGEDGIEFDDRLDDHDVSDADTFTFAFQQVTKDGVSIIYSGFESQKLWTSHVNTSATLFPNTVRLHGIDMPTDIVGTAGNRDNAVDIGHPTFGVSQVTFGTISLDFTAAPAVVNVNDQVSIAARTFQLTTTQLLLPSVVNYAGVAGFNIFAGSGNDTFNVDALGATTNAFFAGNNGNDLMSVGSGGPLGAIQGRVYARGNAGTDELFFTNGLGGGFTSAVLTAGTFTANGGPVHLYDTGESLHIAVNDAGSDINVNGTSAPTTVHGAAGPDLVRVGDGNINVNLAADLHISAGAGSDEIVFDDFAATSISPFISLGYAFDVLGGNERLTRSADTVGGANRIVSSSAVERKVLNAGISNSGVRVYNTLSALRVNTQNGHDGIYVDETASPVSISTGSGIDYLQVGNLPGPNSRPAIVVIEQDEELAGMSVRDSGTLRVMAQATLCDLGTIHDSGPVISGVIDLAGGALLLRTGPFAPTNDAIRGLLSRGRNGGAWNGTSILGAINSSHAAASPALDGVGYGLGAQIAPTTIGTFTVGADDVLVRHTLDGDADLNRQVNLDDFNRLASNFNLTGRVWSHGDATYDGTVNLNDFNAVATNFGLAAGEPASALDATRSYDPAGAVNLDDFNLLAGKFNSVPPGPAAGPAPANRQSRVFSQLFDEDADV